MLIGRVRIGEVLVLCGTVFYRGHKAVKDHRNGIFDRKLVEKQVIEQDYWSDKTGIPAFIDIYAETFKAMEKYIDFILSITDKPIILNGATAEVRLKAIKYAKEIGIIDRVVYMSINYTATSEELDGIEGIENLVIQAFNPGNPFPTGTLEMAEYLLEKVKEKNVKNILLMPTVLDVPGIGLALESLKFLKSKLKYPTVIAPCGVIGYWRKTKVLGEDFKKMGWASVIALSKVYGADIVIYGSIRKASKVFPIAALIESVIAYGNLFRRKPVKKNHPLNKFLRERN